MLGGHWRIPAFENRPWRRIPLGEVLNEHGLQSAGYEAVFSVSVRKGVVNQKRHLGRSFAAKNKDHYRRVLPGDIVYTRSPTGRFPLGIIKQSKTSEPVIVSPLYSVFTPVTTALGTILEAWFESPVAVQNYLAPIVQKGAKNTIAVTSRRFLEGQLYLPLDEAEQKALGAIVSASRAELEAIDQQIEAFCRQKRGLAKVLLTGVLRLPRSDTDGGSTLP